MRLNAPLAKIQPACSPIGSQSERVRMRASARIQPIRNKVAKPSATDMGSENWAKTCAIELKPEVHVTIVDVWSGALRKWTIEYTAEVRRIDMYLWPVLNNTPRINPRKNVS